MKDRWIDFSHLSNAAIFGGTAVLMAGFGTTVRRYFGHLKLNLLEGWASLVLGMFAFVHGFFPFFGGFNAAWMQTKGVRNTFRFIPLHPAYKTLYDEMREYYESEEYKKLIKERGLDG